MRQRGFVSIAYLVAGVAIVGGLYGIYWTIDSRGYGRGAAEISARWQAANRRAEEAERAEARERARLAGRQSAALAAADARARDADARWRAARAAAARAAVPLVVVDCPAEARSLPAPAPRGGGLRLDPGPVRFTAEFVREWDAAWTGVDGQPVFGDPGRPAATSGAASAVGPDEVLVNHAENAARCSDNARRQNALIDLIEDLQARPPEPTP